MYDNCAESDVYEAVSDEEFNEGMDVSDSSSDEESDAVLRAPDGAPSAPACAMESIAPPPPRPPRAPPASSASKLHHWRSDDNPYEALAGQAGQPYSSDRSKKRVFRCADTNVVTMRFNTLKTPSAMHAGEVVTCSRCQAILSHISKIEENGLDKVWVCEFCDHRNVVDVEEEEKPSADDVTFLVEPSLSTTASGPSGRDESLVIFCVDISGSMCVTSEVAGYMELRGGSTLRRMQRMNDTYEDQYLPSQRRDVTYISRLQAVQAAVDHQLGEMSRDFPYRRIGLVAFNNEVSVIGDGTTEAVTVAGDKLKNVEELSKLGSELPSPKAIKETRDFLGEKVFGLEEGGPTALGPALIVALSMASHHPGSKVIVCTDGKANVGLGKLEDYQENPGDDADPAEFYENIAATANSKGVSVSVITIKGTDCKLVHLGKLAEKTGGQVNIVDPLKLREEFANILADRIIATGVVATFILHCGLYIISKTNQESRERREIGNVTMDTEISFEYGVRKRKHAQPEPDPALSRISEVSTSMEASYPRDTLGGGDGGGGKLATEREEKDAEPEVASGLEMSEGEADIPSELPFQLQISYVDVDGAKALRVLTQKRPVTRDRQLAEQHADLSVLGGHTSRLASELALKGEYTQSRGVALMNQRLAWRSTHSSTAQPSKEKKTWYRKVFSKIKSVENVVQKQQARERVTFGRTHSDEEDEGDVCYHAICHEDAALHVPATACAPLHHFVPAQGAFVKPRAQLKKKKVRSEETNDDVASMMYQARGTNSSAFNRDSTE